MRVCVCVCVTGTGLVHSITMYSTLGGVACGYHKRIYSLHSTAVL